MIRNTTRRQKLGWVLFILYLCMLAYFMFFSESFGRLDEHSDYAYNLVPFKEIIRFIRYRHIMGTPAFLVNIAGNVAAFVPCGFFLPIISRRSRKHSNTVLFSLAFSFLLETIQLITKVGSFDVDDLILNTLGAALGFVCYRVVQRARIHLRQKGNTGT